MTTAANEIRAFDAPAMEAYQRRRICVEGIVQGVGFRPFVFQLARRYDLKGWVLNNALGVVIEAEQTATTLDTFAQALESGAPPLAQIVRLSTEIIPLQGDTAFRIAASDDEEEKRAWISPDACLCDDCLRELLDPTNRRYHYPFINCTNCGPRFTIIEDVPYDRPYTTMAEFEMCDACRSEYTDPDDRRFHAQPNACPDCGPGVHLYPEWSEGSQDAIENAAQLLASGKILAVKGLGGFHLACDATCDMAVTRLRTRKHRYDKPFALMVPDLGTARTIGELNAAEEDLLGSRRRPIVLVRRRGMGIVAEAVAPHQNYLGIMLPYTPLHYLLLEAFARCKNGGPAILVMTSGNLSDEPIAFQNTDAVKRLSHIADYFLMHDRDIFMRCDDSVMRVVEVGAELHEMPLRRSRGYVPEPLRVPQPFQVPVLATGAHLKNTFCLAKGDYAFPSQHIGDLENYETYQSFTQGIEHFKRLFDVEPQVVAHDLHPEYLSSKYALEQSLVTNLRSFPIQHHHAHIASVMGEYGVTDRVIGVALDGTGYGTDGTIWGGEFLVADLQTFYRAAYLDPLPLIGGEQAIHQVWRLAAAWLYRTYGEAFVDLNLPFVDRLDRAKWHVLKQMVHNHVNSPLSSAMGRLFDAVAALIGVRDVATYEAQAAIELEMLADPSCQARYPFAFTTAQPRVLMTDEMLGAIVTDLEQGVAPGTISAKFHNTIAVAVAALCCDIRGAHGLHRVALGGGVFQNAFLLTRTASALYANHFEVLVPTKLPPNDGGISFGQALIANARYRGE